MDFSPSGTEYFVLTSISARRPFTAFQSLGSYKFDLIEYGLDFVFFHCTEDNRHIRQRVFSILQDNLTGLRIDALVVEKSRISAKQQAPEAFYPHMLGHLLRHITGKNELDGIGELIVITDSIPVNRKRAAVEKAVTVVSGCCISLYVKSWPASGGLPLLGGVQKMGERRQSVF